MACPGFWSWREIKLWVLFLQFYRQGHRRHLFLRPIRCLHTGLLRVAFVGVTTPESFYQVHTRIFPGQPGQLYYSFCEDDESGQELYDQVQASVDAARTAGADYVILVGHLGEDRAWTEWSLRQCNCEHHGN